MTKKVDDNCVEFVRHLTQSWPQPAAPSVVAAKQFPKDIEEIICVGMPPLKPGMFGACEHEAPFGQYNKSLGPLGTAGHNVLFESDPVFKRADATLQVLSVACDEHFRGIAPRPSAEIVRYARVISRCLGYMRAALNQTYERAHELREMMRNDPVAFCAAVQADPPSAGVLAALALPEAELVESLYREKQSTLGSKRADPSVAVARGIYDRLVKAAPRALNKVLAADIDAELETQFGSSRINYDRILRLITEWRKQAA